MADPPEIRHAGRRAKTEYHAGAGSTTPPNSNLNLQAGARAESTGVAPSLDPLTDVILELFQRVVQTPPSHYAQSAPATLSHRYR